ncbi:type II secretion system minor pseudopilin GspI [Bowmanella dokdonensis]|uniref:Type II secretion system protein I n=1 Tax=Bowmanella dokdonensis TaxID=751969 RepID=A0A939IKY4_9ALTE|nr:type II secretion system minor pseudopilin GspI [Bowmanella dokdonensis]MBN7823648.1 type II secretion system minor pseudopilin GspI [Bowmanella dokdonensis]
MTLLEIMVALLIFALTGTAVMKAAGDHLHNVSMIEEITFATWVANNRLAQVHLEGRWPPQNNQKGSEEMADRTWYWKQVVNETADKDLRQVSVEIRLQENSEQVITSVSTFLARPSTGSLNGN